jgi:glycosyltransferase involved in cell wall biosynthesis
LRVLVFEPASEGHHFAYARLILPAFAEVADSVVLSTTSEALASAQYRMLVQPLECRVEFDVFSRSSGGLVRNAMRQLQALAQSIRRVRPDHVVVPYADGISQLMGATRLLPIFPRGVPLEGLMFRGAFAYPSVSLRRRAFTIASRELASRAAWTRIHHLDPLVLTEIQRRGGGFAARCDLMPDPVDRMTPTDLATARRRLGIPEDGRYVGCVGALDRRKGVDLLIRAFANARVAPNDRLLLVGPHEPHVADMLRGEHSSLVRAERIVSIDRFVSQSDFETAVQAADLICTPYPDHVGSASIVIRGAAAGKLVLGSDYGWIGATIKQFGLGRTCRVTDGSEFTRAIENAIERAPNFSSGEAGRRFVTFHSPENFVACWTSYIRSRLGKPEAPGRLTWKWVLEALDERGTGVP